MAKQATELEQPIGVDEGVEETRQPDLTADDGQGRQPEKSKVNLDEFEEFRKFKAETDKRLTKERQERERLAAQYQQQLEQERRALREKQLAEMDDYQRTQFERDEARQEAAYWREQAARVETQTARERELNSIAQRFGVPREAIEEATSKAEALEMAWDYKQQQEQAQAKVKERESDEQRQRREQKRVANAVDTGGSSRPPVTENISAKLDEAFNSGDVRAYMRLLRESKK